MELTADLVLGNDNGPPVLGNGPLLLGIMSQFGIMLHSVLCCIRDYIAFGVMSFGIMSFGIVSFGVMSFDVMLFSLLSVYRRIVIFAKKYRENC